MVRTTATVILIVVSSLLGAAASAAPVAMNPDPIDFIDLLKPESINITLSSGESSPASLTFTISTLSVSLTHAVDIDFAFDTATTGASAIVNLGSVTGLSVSSGSPTSSLIFSCDFQTPCELDLTYTFAVIPSAADITSNTGPTGAASVTFGVVPEPSTALLVGVGLGVLATRPQRVSMDLW